MLYYLLMTVYVLVCFLLLLVVLLQQGKGGDIASAFGGGGSTQAAFGARAGATLLTRASTVLGTLFILLSLVLAIIGQRGPGSVVTGVGGEPLGAAPVTAPAAPEPTALPAQGATDDDPAALPSGTPD